MTQLQGRITMIAAVIIAVCILYWTISFTYFAVQSAGALTNTLGSNELALDDEPLIEDEPLLGEDFIESGEIGITDDAEYIAWLETECSTYGIGG